MSALSKDFPISLPTKAPNKAPAPVSHNCPLPDPTFDPASPPATAPIGETISWNNPESGHSGSVTPTREGQTDSGDYCRQYKQSIVIDGQVETAYGTACKQGADWVLVN